MRLRTNQRTELNTYDSIIQYMTHYTARLIGQHIEVLFPHFAALFLTHTHSLLIRSREKERVSLK